MILSKSRIFNLQNTDNRYINIRCFSRFLFTCRLLCLTLNLTAMKQLFILSISTLLFQFTIAQSAEPTIPNHADPGILNSIIQSMKKFESEYNCKKRNVGNEVRLPNAVSDYAFDSVYKLSTLRILSSSQDVIKNGRAATLDFNEALKRLSINYAWQGKK